MTMFMVSPTLRKVLPDDPSEVGYWNADEEEDPSPYWGSLHIEADTYRDDSLAYDFGDLRNLQQIDEDQLGAFYDERFAYFLLGDNDKQLQAPYPPANVEFFLCLFLRGDERDAVIGDLIERYGKMHEHLGKRRADLYAYAEVLRSLYHFVKRALFRTSGMVLLGEWIRKLSS